MLSWSECLGSCKAFGTMKGIIWTLKRQKPNF
jgi:hypothetical protein